MSWSKLDDKFFTHPKVVGLSKDAKLLFLCGITHCAGYMTDGFISDAACKLLTATVEAECNAVTELLQVELWHRVDAGYHVHDYLEYNPSKANREDAKRKTAERVAAWRAEQARKDACNAVTNESVTPNVLTRAGAIPIPSRPVPSRKEKEEGSKVKDSCRDSAETARGMRLANPFEAPFEWLEFAKRERPQFDPEVEATKFADYWHAIPGAKGRKTDWAATWRNYVRSDFYGKGQSGNGAPKESAWDRLQRRKAEQNGQNAPGTSNRTPGIQGRDEQALLGEAGAAIRGSPGGDG